MTLTNRTIHGVEIFLNAAAVRAIKDPGVCVGECVTEFVPHIVTDWSIRITSSVDANANRAKLASTRS